MSEIVPVETLQTGQSGRIVEIIGPTEWQHRLEELGLREGRTVQLVKQGEPCIIAIHDQRLSLRCEAGNMILVELDS